MSEKSPNHDDLLEKGLEAWAESEPPSGLPERVLARLRREPATTPAPGEAPRRWTWLLPAAAALLIALAGLILIRGGASRIAGERASPPRAERGAGNAPAPRPAPEAAGLARIADAAIPAAKPPRRSRTPSPSVVRDVFPTPSPLGEEDRLLVAYVTTTPLDEMKNHLGFLDATSRESDETKENR